MRTTIPFRKTYLVSLSFLFFFMSMFELGAQEAVESKWTSFQAKYNIKTSLGFQLWSTYTMNQELFDDSSNSYAKIDNRWNNQLRRSRFTVSGDPYESLSFKLTASLDLVGRDALSATQGGNNNGNVGQFGLWNMWIKWKPIQTSDLFHITAGFQPPQIGRESITGAFNSTSFEKSWSQNYLRRNITGTGPGRAMGINIGGQKNINKDLTLAYDIGLFTPQSFSNLENSQGINASPLFVGRIAFSLGDPESSNYTTSHKINYFGKRRGITLALAGSHHGKTDIFDKNQAVSFDWLLNFDMVNFDGEWTYFSREKNIDQTNLTTVSNGGYVRLGYNLKLTNGRFLEPVLMYVKFNGPTELGLQRNAQLLQSFAGTDQVFDIGVNYHLNQKLKVSLTYTINTGALGASDPGSTFNNYLRDSNKQAIKRGNLLGLALVAIF